MKLYFQADADLNHIIVKAILRREPSVDFQTAHTADLAGLSDVDVLSVAARVVEDLLLIWLARMPKSGSTGFASCPCEIARPFQG